MDEQRVVQDDGETPFLSYDDMYKTNKRAVSSHEQFWEQKTATSDEEEEEELEDSDKAGGSSRKGFFATNNNNSKARVNRFSSLSMLPRLSSLRLSDLSERAFGSSFDHRDSTAAPVPGETAPQPAQQQQQQSEKPAVAAEDREPKATRISSKLFSRWSNLGRRSQLAE